MDWPTWNEAAVAALVSSLLAFALRRWWPRLRATGLVAPAAAEFAFVAALYSVWRVARTLPLTRDEGAIDRARQIVRLENDLHVPTELSLQHVVLDHVWLARLTNAYYGSVHVPALIAFLIWLYVRHRESYPRWRNGLAILTAFCLVIRFVRVAPPRFLPDLGYVDLSTRYGMDLYGPVGTGVSDQFAAMPSIHVGWAAVVSFGVVAAGTSRWRWLFLLHVVITVLVVSASGHHWWLDGIVAIALLGVALLMDSAGRRLAARYRVPRVTGDDPEPSGGGGSDHAGAEPARAQA